MNFSNIKIEGYILSNSMDVPEYLIQLERETNLTTLMPQMLSGRLQGRLLSFISKMVNPENILEIGTFTGYSALCLAEGLRESGKLTTIEYDPEMKNIIEKYIGKSGMQDKIEVIFDDAKNVLDKLNNTYDLVFLDAFKEDYILYYENIIPRLKSGGIIIADNVLWSGKVITEPDDKTASAIIEFNRHVNNDPRTENIILPIRDGLSLIRKLG
ncbi:MAG TPA: methyltransferase [Saprospiraceae bacterium]|nr:methyltransferase [Saprospiraceae bacterium]